MVTHTFWTEAEIELIKREYPIIGRSGIYKLLPYRSYKSIDSKANRFHLRQHYEYRNSSFDTEFLEGLPEATKAYVAGFFDGEGTIGVRTRKRPYNTTNPNHQMFISCSNTNEEVIRYLHKLFNGSFFICYDARGKRRTCYRWGLTSRKVKQFLESIYPYLVVKKEEAAVAIALANTFEHEGYVIPAEVIEKRNLYASELTRLKGRIH